MRAPSPSRLRFSQLSFPRLSFPKLSSRLSLCLVVAFLLFQALVTEAKRDPRSFEFDVASFEGQPLRTVFIIDPRLKDRSDKVAVVRDVGSFDDIDVPGQQHLLEHTLFRGSKHFPEHTHRDGGDGDGGDGGDSFRSSFEGFLSSRGGSVNAATFRDAMVMGLSIPSGDLSAGLAHVLDAAFNPAITEEGVLSEISAVDAEHRLNRQDASHVAFAMLSNALDFPLNTFPTGDQTTLQRDDIVSLVRRAHTLFQCTRRSLLLIASARPLAQLERDRDQAIQAITRDGDGGGGEGDGGEGDGGEGDGGEGDGGNRKGGEKVECEKRSLWGSVVRECGGDGECIADTLSPKKSKALKYAGNDPRLFIMKSIASQDSILEHLLEKVANDDDFALTPLLVGAGCRIDGSVKVQGSPLGNRISLLVFEAPITEYTRDETDTGDVDCLSRADSVLSDWMETVAASVEDGTLDDQMDLMNHRDAFEAELEPPPTLNSLGLLMSYARSLHHQYQETPETPETPGTPETGATALLRSFIETIEAPSHLEPRETAKLLRRGAKRAGAVAIRGPDAPDLPLEKDEDYSVDFARAPQTEIVPLPAGGTSFASSKKELPRCSAERAVHTPERSETETGHGVSVSVHGSFVGEADAYGTAVALQLPELRPAELALLGEMASEELRERLRDERQCGSHVSVSADAKSVVFTFLTPQDPQSLHAFFRALDHTLQGQDRKRDKDDQRDEEETAGGRRLAALVTAARGEPLEGLALLVEAARFLVDENETFEPSLDKQLSETAESLRNALGREALEEDFLESIRDRRDHGAVHVTFINIPQSEVDKTLGDRKRWFNQKGFTPQPWQDTHTRVLKHPISITLTKDTRDKTAGDKSGRDTSGGENSGGDQLSRESSFLEQRCGLKERNRETSWVSLRLISRKKESDALSAQVLASELNDFLFYHLRSEQRVGYVVDVSALPSALADAIVIRVESDHLDSDEVAHAVNHAIRALQHNRRHQGSAGEEERNAEDDEAGSKGLDAELESAVSRLMDSLEAPAVELRRRARPSAVIYDAPSLRRAKASYQAADLARYRHRWEHTPALTLTQSRGGKRGRKSGGERQTSLAADDDTVRLEGDAAAVSTAIVNQRSTVG